MGFTDGALLFSLPKHINPINPKHFNPIANNDKSGYTHQSRAGTTVAAAHTQLLL